MILKECMLEKNKCFISGSKMKPIGIVVHSTGANNNQLRRYVAPYDRQKNYNEIIADIGKNQYNNHWNTYQPDGKSVCVNAFIGKNAKGTIETYQTLPWDTKPYGCGSGKNGSYNNTKIQFEICEDSLTDATYFYAAMKEAQELCVYLCKKYGFGVDKICSHHEAYLEGMGSNHADCDHWLKKFGKDMNWFRSEVQKLLNTSTGTSAVKPVVVQKTNSTCTVTVPILKRGDENDSAKMMQTLLITRGYSCGSSGADGSFGPATETALKEFQRKNKLDVDGKCGPVTWGKLLN